MTARHPDELPDELTVCGHLCRRAPLPLPTWLSETAPNGTAVDLTCQGVYEGERSYRWRAVMTFAGTTYAVGEGASHERAVAALSRAVLLRGAAEIEDLGSRDLEGARSAAERFAADEVSFDEVPA